MHSIQRNELISHKVIQPISYDGPRDSNQDQQLQSQSENGKMVKEIDRSTDVSEATFRALRFKYNKEAQEIVVQVVDTRTQEVVESLPPDYMLKLASKLKEMTGTFFDQKM